MDDQKSNIHWFCMLKGIGLAVVCVKLALVSFVFEKTSLPMVEDNIRTICPSMAP